MKTQPTDAKRRKAFQLIVGQALQEKVCSKHFDAAKANGLNPIRRADVGLSNVMGICYACAADFGERPY